MELHKEEVYFISSLHFCFDSKLRVRLHFSQGLLHSDITGVHQGHGEYLTQEHQIFAFIPTGHTCKLRASRTYPSSYCREIISLLNANGR